MKSALNVEEVEKGRIWHCVGIIRLSALANMSRVKKKNVSEHDERKRKLQQRFSIKTLPSTKPELLALNDVAPKDKEQLVQSSTVIALR